MKRKYFLLFGLLIFVAFISARPVMAQQKINPDSIREKMQWFADAKLGIFIHWGIYSVNGIDESWSFHNKKISFENYMKQLSGFTASKYNPQAWADLIKRVAHAMQSSRQSTTMALRYGLPNKITIM